MGGCDRPPVWPSRGCPDRFLVHDEQRGADIRVRAMWLGVVGYLIAHPRAQRKDPAVPQLGVELALGAKQDVPLDAPVIREIARRVLHHAHANSPEDPGAPERHAALASMLRALDLRPIGRTKRYGGHVHEITYRSRPAAPASAQGGLASLSVAPSGSTEIKDCRSEGFGGLLRRIMAHVVNQSPLIGAGEVLGMAFGSPRRVDPVDRPMKDDR